MKQLVKTLPKEADQRALAKRSRLQRVFQEHAQRAELHEVTVSSIMSPDPFTVSQSTTAVELVQLFQEHRFRHFLVVDDGQLVGVLSDRDVIRLFGAEDFGGRNVLEEFTAGDLMSDHVLSVEPDSSLREAVTMMVSAVINCLPVVESGRPVGILTGTDMYLALEQLLYSLD
jgi:acetoin utilization protein AcuB